MRLNDRFVEEEEVAQKTVRRGSPAKFRHIVPGALKQGWPEGRPSGHAFWPANAFRI